MRKFPGVFVFMGDFAYLCAVFGPNNIGTMTDQRVNIVKIAGDMFFRLGVRSVSIDDICREMGISKKTFYVYFESKDELVAQILQANLDYMSNKAETLLKKDDFRSWVTGFIKRQRDEKNDVRRVPQLVYDLQKYYPRQFEEFQNNAFNKEKTHIRRFLERGIEEGLVRANLDVEYTSTLFAKIHNDSIRDLEMMESHGMNMVKLSHVAMDVFVRGVLSDEGLKLYSER